MKDLYFKEAKDGQVDLRDEADDSFSQLFLE